jgi:hypothetical protein
MRAAQSVQRTGGHEGPTIHFDRPPAGTLAPFASFVSRLGRPGGCAPCSRNSRSTEKIRMAKYQRNFVRDGKQMTYSVLSCLLSCRMLPSFRQSGLTRVERLGSSAFEELCAD